MEWSFALGELCLTFDITLKFTQNVAILRCMMTLIVAKPSGKTIFLFFLLNCSRLNERGVVTLPYALFCMYEHLRGGSIPS